jgi:hypothetical protein
MGCLFRWLFSNNTIVAKTSIDPGKSLDIRTKEVYQLYRPISLAIGIDRSSGQQLSSLQESLADIEEEMCTLESRLNDLHALKQLILSKVHKIGIGRFEEDERKVLYKIVKESPRSIAHLSDMVGEKESSLKTIINGIRNKMDGDSAKILLDLQ